jgi:hypothetical protein
MQHLFPKQRLLTLPEITGNLYLTDDAQFYSMELVGNPPGKGQSAAEAGVLLM